MATPIPKGLVVFTDLDGTLLDHETYDFAPAAAMLVRLRAAGVPVVLASSKTAAEIALWQERMGLTQCPAIVENGAGAQEISPSYRRLIDALGALGMPFRGFAQMTDAEVAQLTGLSLRDARLAREREYSEPGLWQGDENALPAFLAALEPLGIRARKGGRFLTLSFGGTKAERMAALIARMHPVVTVALGDAPNDAEMLTLADYAVIVRNDHGPGLPVLAGEASGRIIRSRASGPQGWAEGLNSIFERLASHDTRKGV